MRPGIGSAYKIIICVLAVVLLMVDPAAASLPTTQAMNDATFMEQLTTVLAWLWIPLALGAGKLMNNGFIYGEFLNFDIYLRQLRNITKNFANMTIGLMFLYYILKFIFQSDQTTGNDIAKKIGGFLLAGVLIQASWFITGALLDIEKITTSAMAALPGIVIQSDSSRGSKVADIMDRSGVLGKSIHLSKDTSGMFQIEPPSAPQNFINTSPESVLDSILPRYDMLSGPLFFLGFGMFQFHSYGNTSFSNINNLQEFSRVLSAAGIKLIVVAAFTIMMLILFVVNIIRVAYLWAVIAFAPLIVLYLVLKDVVGISIGGESDGILSKIKLEVILAYIFQPTIIVTFMGIMLIAVVGLRDGMSRTTDLIQEYGFTITTGSVEHSTFYLKTEGELLPSLQDTGRSIFKDLIMMIMIFAMLLGLIVLTTSLLRIEFLNKAAKSLGNALASVPFIPVFTVARAGGNILRDTTGIDLMSPTNRGKLDTKGTAAMEKILGLPQSNTPKEDRYLVDMRRSIKSPTRFFQNIRAWKDARDGEFILGQRPGLNQVLVDFIKEYEGKDVGFGTLKTIKQVTNIDNKEQFGVNNLETYLNDPDNKKIFYNAIINNPSNTDLPSKGILQYNFNNTTQKK